MGLRWTSASAHVVADEAYGGGEDGEDVHAACAYVTDDDVDGDAGDEERE